MGISLKIHMMNSINWKKTQFMLSSTGQAPDIYATRLKLKNKNSTLDLSVRWPGYDFDFRVIAFWYKKKKRIGYLVTNLARETVPASDVVELYRLRWQIE
jgi:IS4 transposase